MIAKRLKKALPYSPPDVEFVLNKKIEEWRVYGHYLKTMCIQASLKTE